MNQKMNRISEVLSLFQTDWAHGLEPGRGEEKPEESGVGRSLQSPSGAPPGKVSLLSSRPPSSAWETMKVGGTVGWLVGHIRSISVVYSVQFSLNVIVGHKRNHEII